MIIYEKNNLSTYRPTDDGVYLYFNIVLKGREFDNVYHVIHDRAQIYDFRNYYMNIVSHMDYQNITPIKQSVRLLCLRPRDGYWLPRYCWCVPCIAETNYYGQTMYTFDEAQLEQQLICIKESISCLSNSALLIPYCADNKMSKDEWDNILLPVILNLFTKSNDKCIIIPPLEGITTS